MEKIVFTILGKPITKKNSQRIVICKNRPLILPSKAYLKYEKDCKKYMPDTKQIDYPINVKAVYYMPTRHRVDLTNRKKVSEIDKYLKCQNNELERNQISISDVIGGGK